MTVGRNDPCPCGSGKKYKKCCLGKEAPARSDAPAGVAGELRQALEGREFGSLAEAQAFAERFMSRRNRAPADDFAGLSPEQMFRFLNFPWDSPELVTLPAVVAGAAEAPIGRLFGLLAAAIGEAGLKPTATGNLPRNFCREAALTFWGEESFREKTRFRGINKEDDFPELHVTRLVGELAGLVRRYRGRFILSRECRRLLTEHGSAGLYPRLLQAYARDFNWSYRDRYPELEIIQRSFLFTLYLLQRYGDEERPHAFYEDAFLRAFPRALDEVPSDYFFPADSTVRGCFTLRALVNFAGFFGLATVVPITASIFCKDFRVQKLPLLAAAIRFHLPR
jgi:hypothetical protein